jgi:predicted NACHT family NTPase
VSTLAEILRATSKDAQQTDVLLQGAAGTGKSTTLGYITAYAWSRPQMLGLSRPHLPIVIRLQVVADVGGASLEERLLNVLRRTRDLVLERTPPKGFFHEWSKRENAPWLLLLDGLDEVAADDRGETLRWIKDLLRMLEGQHRVILTSRPASDDQYQELASYFTVYDVLPFDEEQRIDLARRWIPDTADDFLTKVNRISAGNLFREPLVMTPLLLTIAAAVYRRNGDLPESGQVELYGRFIDILFEEARQRGLRDELGEEVFDIARSGLGKLALATTERPTENTLAALTQVSAELLQKELEWRRARAETRGRQFVEVMGRRTGVLYRQGESFRQCCKNYFEARKFFKSISSSSNLKQGSYKLRLPYSIISA